MSAVTNTVSPILYRAPEALERTVLEPRKIIMLGACLSQAFLSQVARAGCEVEFMLTNNPPSLPQSPPLSPSEYDFQIVQAPLRFVVFDMAYGRLAYADIEGHNKLFTRCKERLLTFLEAALKWNKELGIATFVWGFLPPQQNPTGRLLPRYDLRNMVYFIEELNKVIAETVSQSSNCYYYDLESCLSTFGRRFFQDDVITVSNHGGFVLDSDLDIARLAGDLPPTQLFPQKRDDCFSAIWREHVAMWRTLRQVDPVKLLITDLDNTLWRGIPAEQMDLAEHEAIEGWPIGYAEALHYLRRRGVLLAVCSKNDESRVLELWKQLYYDRLSPSDFASLKINWRPKADNIAEILAEVNLLPKNVLFIDDNPVERAAVESAFPGIRTLGSNPILWRRELLWGAETQVPNITVESDSRTEMVRAQVERDHLRQKSSRQEFLKSLQLEITLFEISGPSTEAFRRILELLNKTNQFNTTGRRWTEQELRQHLNAGGRLFAFKVRDKFTSYGTVGGAIVEAAHLTQFIMSCRVVGMDVEVAVIAKIVEALGATGLDHVTAEIVETPANLVCRDLYRLAGFQSSIAGQWSRLSSPPPAVPEHAIILVEDDPAVLST